MNAIEELKAWFQAPITIEDEYHGGEDFEAMAERLEKEYIELPSGSNGDVVRVGDTLYELNEKEIIKADYLRINGMNAWCFNTLGGAKGYIPVRVHELCKAPYDKNGVEIKVGDWVKLLSWDKPDIVESITTGGVGKIISTKESTFWCGWTPKNSCKWEVVPELDTQEKIDADVEKDDCLYFGNPSICDDCPAHKQDCSEEKTRDLLRRQRILDGVAHR